MVYMGKSESKMDDLGGTPILVVIQWLICIDLLIFSSWIVYISKDSPTHPDLVDPVVPQPDDTLGSFGIVSLGEVYALFYAKTCFFPGEQEQQEYQQEQQEEEQQQQQEQQA